MTDASPPEVASGSTYRLTVSYLGTRYAGWQRQPNGFTVQEALEEALARLTGESIRVLGAGRTDAGVHARGQVASLRLARSWEERALVHGTNRHLPDDVRVMAAARVDPSFHPQRDALGKEYRYRLLAVPVASPLDTATALRVAPGVDFAAIRDATAVLVGRHDFRAFAKTGGSHDDPVRTVFAAGWEREPYGWALRIVGDGFLRGMVRAVVGTLLEVGRGRRTPDDLERLVRGAARGEAGPNAAARGLVLQEVYYRQADLDAAREAVATLP